MSDNVLLPELAGEIPGVTDIVSLQRDVDSLKAQLTVTTEQMALERQLAMNVHRARNLAVISNPTLSLIFDIQDTDTPRTKPYTAEEILASAFLARGEQAQLSEGYAKDMAKRLRVESHPDRGHNAAEAGIIAGYLEGTKVDPSYSIAGALATKQTSSTATAQDLRDERYHLTIALSGSNLRFQDRHEAEQHAETEIEGAEWRMRTYAAMKCLELIIGSSEIWNQFLQRIGREGHMPTIEMVNQYQPAIQALNERVALGDPIKLGDAAKQEIDEVLERIWTTLRVRDDDLLPYEPPYGNWFPILLQAMQRLDPGEKPGVEYTYFEPPFRTLQDVSTRHTTFSKDNSGGFTNDGHKYKQTIFNSTDKYGSDKGYY